MLMLMLMLMLVLVLVLVLVLAFDSRFTFCHPACRAVAQAKAGGSRRISHCYLLVLFLFVFRILLIAGL